MASSRGAFLIGCTRCYPTIHILWYETFGKILADLMSRHRKQSPRNTTYAHNYQHSCKNGCWWFRYRCSTLHIAFMCIHLAAVIQLCPLESTFGIKLTSDRARGTLCSSPIGRDLTAELLRLRVVHAVNCELRPLGLRKP